MKSVAFFNNKGGVGKTTLLCNIAAFLAIDREKTVCVIDADPQCNATQYFFDDEVLSSFYDSQDEFTIYELMKPISTGEGYSGDIKLKRADRFKVDVLPGDPRLALIEDLLANDWGDARAGGIRGIRTSLVFSQLLQKLIKYDYVLFDASPSLGAINRSVMLSADYFVSPISLDIFSLKAFENIASWIEGWWADWENGIKSVRQKELIPVLPYSRPEFIGYVTQSYLAKRDKDGQVQAVQAYEKIRKKIDGIIKENHLDSHLKDTKFEVGTVPNLFSLVPMSQSSHTPIFNLAANDGVVGAHFVKVKESYNTFGKVVDEFLERTK